MKQNVFFALTVSMACVLCMSVASCNSEEENEVEIPIAFQEEESGSLGEEGMGLPDFWSTPCKGRETRGDYEMTNPWVKGVKGNGLPSLVRLTREKDIIAGCIIDKESECGSPNFIVGNTIEGDTLQIFLTEERVTGGEHLDCICKYDIYFTIRDVTKGKYYLQFSIKNLKYIVYEGWISFENSPGVELKPVAREEACQK